MPIFTLQALNFETNISNERSLTLVLKFEKAKQVSSLTIRLVKVKPENYAFSFFLQCKPNLLNAFFISHLKQHINYPNFQSNPNMLSVVNMPNTTALKFWQLIIKEENIPPREAELITDLIILNCLSGKVIAEQLLKNPLNTNRFNDQVLMAEYFWQPLFSTAVFELGKLLSPDFPDSAYKVFKYISVSNPAYPIAQLEAAKLVPFLTFYPELPDTQLKEMIYTHCLRAGDLGQPMVKKFAFMKMCGLPMSKITQSMMNLRLDASFETVNVFGQLYREQKATISQKDQQILELQEELLKAKDEIKVKKSELDSLYDPPTDAIVVVEESSRPGRFGP